jgi:hypothetical protein
MWSEAVDGDAKDDQGLRITLDNRREQEMKMF